VKTLPNLSHRCLRLCFNTTLLVALTAIGQPIAANDNDILGHELYSRKDYSSAAEVFDDPLWKGIALYRSEQWWRAAEAFVRGNDARSFHNLGNTYVKMGYYALALEAYQQALQKQPDFVEAAANAKIMRELIALRMIAIPATADLPKVVKTQKTPAPSARKATLAANKPAPTGLLRQSLAQQRIPTKPVTKNPVNKAARPSQV